MFAICPDYPILDSELITWYVMNKNYILFNLNLIASSHQT